MSAPVISVLPPEIAARIAAGEVVERPSSVVRELLDNAIDAGASRISVEIEDGGITMIRIVDNGRGIPPGDVELAFERHATSKISTLDDLAGIRSLGFRGEALPSIAAAADIDLVTRHEDESVGVHLAIVSGAVARRHSRSSPQGTSIAVLDLFGRLPARRKFLGTPAGEGRSVGTLVAHYALAYAGIAIRFVNGNRTAMQTAGDGNIRHAFAGVYSAEIAGAMLTVDATLDGIRVSGLAGPPDQTRGNRTGISIFVNGRWIQSRQLTFAATDAYQSLLPGGRYPLVALSVAIPAGEVDVNVHPAKAEVRFRDERLVGRAVRQAVAAAVGAAPPASWREPHPGGRGGGVSLPPLRERLAAALHPPAPLQAGLPGAPGESGTMGDPSQRDTLPLLRVLGQALMTYVVCEGPDGLYLLDQHAAHERVVYDRLKQKGDGGPGQPLLEPALLELDPATAAVAAEQMGTLEGTGLLLEPFGERSFLVRSVPAGTATVDPLTMVRAVLEELAGGARSTPPGTDRATATVACHTSVRAGMAMSVEEAKQLLLDLEATPRPRTCPHGRPTLIRLSPEVIERQFGRR